VCDIFCFAVLQCLLVSAIFFISVSFEVVAVGILNLFSPLNALNPLENESSRTYYRKDLAEKMLP
jgi:hypothetical protein